MLELSRDIGDFLFALLQVPLDYILSSPWFSFRRTGELEEVPDESPPSARISSVDSGGSTRGSSQSNISIPADHPVGAWASRVQIKRHGSARGVADNQHSNGRPSVNSLPNSRISLDRRSKSAYTTSLPVYDEHPSHDSPRYSQTLCYSPAPAHPASSPKAPITTLDLSRTAPEYHSVEWRTYPAFPSAYPPTPLPASASLPSSVARRSDNDRRVVSDSAYPSIPEDEQGFGELLGRQHEGHPGSVHSSSDSNDIPSGVHGYEISRDAPRQQDEDTLLDDSMCSSETGLSEDDFGASLRTPHRSPEAMPSGAYSSVDSLTSALTTTDNACSLRTRISSDSLSSESSSLAGRKRAHGTFQGEARNTLQTSQYQNATLRGRPAPPSILKDSLQSNSSEDEGESQPGDDGGTKVKRQRVLDPAKRKSTVRPVLRVMGSARKALPSRSTTARSRAVATASQATLQSRAGSGTTNNTNMRGRKSTLVPRQVMRGRAQEVVTKSSSTSSSQSGTLKGRAP